MSTAGAVTDLLAWIGEARPRAIVLVEGPSDSIALEVLAERKGRDLASERVSIVEMGGATGAGNFMEALGPAGVDVALVGLYDVAEERGFRRGLQRAGIGSDLSSSDMERLGFYACRADLEAELIRAIGVAGMECIIERQGELRALRTFQRQPQWEGRPAAEQLRRFMGTRGGRKRRYARLMVEALDLTRVPYPLEAVLAHI